MAGETILKGSARLILSLCALCSLIFFFFLQRGKCSCIVLCECAVTVANGRYRLRVEGMRGEDGTRFSVLGLSVKKPTSTHKKIAKQNKMYIQFRCFKIFKINSFFFNFMIRFFACCSALNHQQMRIFARYVEMYKWLDEPFVRTETFCLFWVCFRH